MTFKRSSGILLHPSSLPGPYGIGDLGPQAYRFVDWLSSTGCKLWQTLPGSGVRDVLKIAPDFGSGNIQADLAWGWNW